MKNTIVNMTKGELMELVYTANELRHIDVNLPISIISQLKDHNLDPFFYVMNYNHNILGTLEKMEIEKELINETGGE